MYCLKIICLLLFLVNLAIGQSLKSSLTFVIDDTYSMSNDIDRVIEGSSLVFDTVLNTNSSQIEDFVLVTFNDPQPPILRIKTRDRERFKKELLAISVHGGGECPELSMGGIELALRESRPNSMLYVSTDASACDAHLFESVQNIAIKKGSQIFFLLTGTCDDSDVELQFSPYYKLASATSGLVFHIHKQQVDEIMKFVAENVRGPKTVLGTTVLDPNDYQDVNVSVDSGINEIYVSVSGATPVIENVNAPEDQLVVNLENVKVVKVPIASPGTYTFKVGSKSKTRVLITASTSITFNYGFLQIEPTSLNDTAPQPIAGQNTHLAIQLDTTNSGATLNTVDITDMDGFMLLETSLRLIDKTNKLYTTDLFMPPSTMFKITVKGYDKESSSTFERTSTTALQPQKPELETPENRKPSVRVPRNRILNDYNHSLKMSCFVEGFPKPDIIWVNEQGVLVPSTQTMIASPYKYLSILEIETVTSNQSYTCKAINSMGEDSKVVDVILDIEKPVLDKTTSVIRIKKGEDVQIMCRVKQGKPIPKITYFFQSSISVRIMHLEHEDIKLKSVNEYDAGDYSCMAVNDIGHDQHTIRLIVEYPPTIDPVEDHLNSTKGRRTTLACNVQGEPRPRVEWFLNDVKIISDRNHHIYRDNSLSFWASKENEGRFTCVASNYLGSEKKTMLVNFVDPVSIEPPEETTFKQKLGDSLTLPCKAHGYPRPTTKWVFYKTPKSLSKEIRSRSSPLLLNNLHTADEGYYVCVASNVGSAANMTYQVIVEAPPTIEKGVNKTFSAVSGDLMAIIPCNATGNPKPTIIWTRKHPKLDLMVYIPADTEWYDIKKDGSLIIKNVNTESAGLYICHATNYLGEDTEVYILNVKGYPDDKIPTKNIKMEVGSSEIIECDIRDSFVDVVHWYKDKNMIEEGLGKTVISKEGKLMIRDAKISDSGEYTCRVQSMGASSPQTATVNLTVGMKPTFVTTDPETIIEFETDMLVFADCLADGEPPPQVTWSANGNKLALDEMVHYLQIMGPEDMGNYTCVVSNTFGSIFRTFTIISKDCFLNIKTDLANNNQPLMYQKTYKDGHIYGDWPAFDKHNDYLQIPHGKNNITIHCPNGFMTIPGTKVLEAVCDDGNKFKVNGKLKELSDLACQEEVPFTVLRSGIQCRGTGTEQLKVGYISGKLFIEAYEVCLDKKVNTPVYTKQTLRPTLADVEPNNDIKWRDHFLLPLNFDELYDCKNQRATVSSILGRPFHEDDKCCFKKRQLVNPRDLPAGVAPKTAFSHLNVVPHWSACNNNYTNWDELERRVRKLAEDPNNDIVVWTGASHHLELSDDAGKSRQISLKDNRHLQQAVPKYLWKVIQNKATNSSVAVIQLNIPDLTSADGFNNEVCVGVCHLLPWMEGRTWKNAKYGYTFCCKLDRFEKVFRYKGHFGAGNGDLFVGSMGIIPRFYSV